MTEDEQFALVERFVLSCEKTAAALEGLNDTYQRHYAKLYPEKREAREAVVTRVPTREDQIREKQGASDRPLDEWLSDIEREEEDAEDIGVREREWLEGQKPHAGAEAEA